jgi:DNA gyrase inhibitor GyrI
MSSNLPAHLNVSFNELPARHVVFLVYWTNQAAGDFDQRIREHFEQLKSWAKERGVDITTVPAIGIAQVDQGQLQAYECCIPIPDTLSGADKVSTKILPGGRYAIVQIEKQSEIIGETIGRFFQEYVPSTNLRIDNSRPTYEIYWDKTMDFCVPVLP